MPRRVPPSAILAKPEPGSIPARIAGLEHLIAVIMGSDARNDDAAFAVEAARRKIAWLRMFAP